MTNPNELRAVDLFAGAGGFSSGAVAAGARVVWAANHWRAAVDVHAAAHPNTVHACQDLCQADFTAIPRHDVLLASPACQGHSRARGKERAHHDATRATAWAVIAAVEAHEPEAVVVENVEDFRRWKLFPVWRSALEAYGYAITERVIDAADLGVAQHRERLFLVASRRGPIEIEVPELENQVAAESILDWESGSWSAIHKPRRAAKTIERIERATANGLGDRFLVAYYGSEKHGRRLDRPLGTVTTRDRFVLVDTAAGRLRCLTPVEYRRAMGFPESYDRILARVSRKKAVHLLGNAVVPQVAELVVGQVAAALRGGFSVAT